MKANTATKQLKRTSVWIWVEDYPYSLTDEELTHPALVLDDVFSQYSLADCQYLLWEWQHCHYRPFMFSFGDGLLTLFRFKKMLNKLVDVSWLLTCEEKPAKLLQHCTPEFIRSQLKSHYFISLKNEDIICLKTLLQDMLNEEGGLQGWKNTIYHWWGVGNSPDQLDDGGIGNPTDEIPQFIQLSLMIEIQYLIYMSLKNEPPENRYAASAYLSAKEGQQPFKTLIHIFRKWEYEELKENLRKLYYHLDFGMDVGNVREPNGLIHTQHKLIALGATLSGQAEEYFTKEGNLNIRDDELGNFWEYGRCIPFHHLSEHEYKNPVTALRGFALEELHRELHRFTHILAKGSYFMAENEGPAFNELFRKLERLTEILYLLTMECIDINHE